MGTGAPGDRITFPMHSSGWHDFARGEESDPRRVVRILFGHVDKHCRWSIEGSVAIIEAITCACP